MSIIVIGNGPSVLNNKYGSYIDKFDEVVRINHYKPEFKEYIGEKLTTYITSTYLTKFYEMVPKISNQILILDPLNRKKSPYDSYKHTSYIDTTLINPYLVENGFFIFPNKPWASSGIEILTYLIYVKKYKHICIYGFDNLVYDEKQHYFEELKTSSDTPHSFEKEKNFIEHHINNKILIKLEDYIKIKDQSNI
jgi:hypothetical protein